MDIASVNLASDANLLNSASSILLTSDFNGDGKVNFKDVFLVQIAAIQSIFGRNDAIFDRNADGKVDILDIQETIADLGQESSLLDQQLAEIYQETRPYFSRFGLVRAILSEQYGAFTPAF